MPTGCGFLAAEPEPNSVLIPENLPSDVVQMAASAADFMGREVLPAADRIEAKEPGLIPGLLRRAGELGLLATDIPEVYGGLGISKSASARVAEALAVEPSFAVSHSVHSTVATLPLVFFGTAEQSPRYLPRLASGELIGAYALTEAHAGTDAMAARARAVQSADGSSYTITGEKMWITNAAFAGLFTVFAKVDDRMTAFLVERDFPGVSVGREEHKLGLNGSSTCRLILENAIVPSENVLGSIGEGGRIALLALNLGRFKIAASSVGQCKNLIGMAARYANQRQAFGKSISEFGLIREKLANMAARTFAAESMLYRVAGYLDAAFEDIDPLSADAQPRYQAAAAEYAVECAIIKVACTEALGFVADETVQIFGGYGYSEEFPAARAWRDSRVTRIYEGTNEINRLNIPALLRKRIESGRMSVGDEETRLALQIVKGHPDRQQLAAAFAELLIMKFAGQSTTLRRDLAGCRKDLLEAAWQVSRADAAIRGLAALRVMAGAPGKAGRNLWGAVRDGWMVEPPDLLGHQEVIAKAIVDREGYPW